jgi:hypothetical protein
VSDIEFAKSLIPLDLKITQDQDLPNLGNNENKLKNISETSSNEMRQSIYRCMSSNLRQVAADSHQNNSVRSHGVIHHDMNRITSQKVLKIGLE